MENVFTQRERRDEMSLGLTIIVIGVLILMNRMDMGYGLKEGWAWILVALGAGGIFRNGKSFPAWVTTIIGVLILGAKYYTLKFSIPDVVRTFFLPALLIVIGLLWIWKYHEE